VALCIAIIVRNLQQRKAIDYGYVGEYCATFTVAFPASS